jgi:hypothetical protein
VSRPTWLSELDRGLVRGSNIPTEHGDFGGAPARAPWAWVETESVREVQHVFDVARRHAVPVALRGSGHTSGGHTSAPEGIVLLHRPPHEDLELGAGEVSVPGHWTWSRVEQALHRLGRDLPVTTSSVETTVAGTLSLAGIGPRSVRQGLQVDQVTQLSLIAADGTQLRCSARDSAEVFHSALTGMGQLGLVERATLRTAARLPYLCASLSECASFSELAERILPLAEPGAVVPDDFRVLIKQGKLECFRATRHATPEQAQRAARMPDPAGLKPGERRVLEARDFERGERAMPVDLWRGCRQLWSDYCFEPGGFSRFARFIDAQLAGSLHLHLAYVLCLAPRNGAPLALDLRPRSAQRSFSVGLFYSVPKEHRSAIEHARQAQQSALAECLALGGKPYLHGLWGGREGLSARELEQIFGPGYSHSRALRERFDPGGILNPHALN